MPRRYKPRNECKAKRLKAEGYCRRPAGWGTGHPGFGRCRKHGGRSPGGEKYGRRLMAEAALNGLGVEIEVDPFTALMQQLYEAYGNVAFYRALVSQLNTEPVEPEYVIAEDDHGRLMRGDMIKEGEAGLFGRMYHLSGIATGEAKEHIWVKMYNDERRHLKALIQLAIDSEIDERYLKLAEATAQSIVQLLRGILNELNVLHNPETPAIVRRHLAGYIAAQN